MTELLPQIEVSIATWHGIVAPNQPAREMAEDLALVIAAFAALRGSLMFEDEPANFETALRSCSETGPQEPAA